VNQKEKISLGFFKSLLLFLKSKRFRVHFIISVLLSIAVFWIAFKSLGTYTHHGESITVPDLSGVEIYQLDKIISENKLRYQIIDSVFEPKNKGGIVIKQDPEKNSSVKQNRTVYLTVSATMPPLVKMPNLVDASMRQALALLESYGLKAGKRDFRSDPCVNCVLTQMMKGKKIEHGTPIPKGSTIDLILGKGEGEDKINVPCVIGLTPAEAIAVIAESGFSEGAMICKDCKSLAEQKKARVFSQSPGCASDHKINPGGSIDLYLSTKEKIAVQQDSLDEEDEE